MRRTTPGVAHADDLLDPALAEATSAARDPERVVRLLEPLVTEARRARLRQVLARRLGSVAVILDAPYDPHNGAAILRSCEAFGVQELHVVERDDTRFAVARSVSRGSQKWLDVTRHDGPATALSWAAARGLPLVGAEPDGELEPAELASMPRVALVLGNERAGIRPAIAAACQARVRVPMSGFVESLNMSVTAAILLYAATLGRPGDLPGPELERLYARGLYLSVPHAAEVLSSGR